MYKKMFTVEEYGNGVNLFVFLFYKNIIKKEVMVYPKN